MSQLVMGIVAHVDAGKTTLSEAMLYSSGHIRKIGRVDNKDAYLDTYALERERGITIFSKQAMLDICGQPVTLLDTPGHVDFSAEMERTLQVLDYAILVVSGADGVQGHTKTLWKLLKEYEVPTFIFVNKMDQNGTDKEAILADLKKRLDEGCIDFTDEGSEDFYDQVAMCDEEAMEAFLEEGEISAETVKHLISGRKVFPCYFGSALKLMGIEAFMQGFKEHILEPEYEAEFGARVFKITRDDNGNRQTHVKITGGVLKVRELLSYESEAEEKVSEKVNQIRIYDGEKFEAVNEAEAGTVCVLTGLTKTYAGQGLGVEASCEPPILTPVLNYAIHLPQGCDPAQMLPKLKLIEEESPELHIIWNEQLHEIQAQLMGEVQIEILQHMIKERFGIEVSFGIGRIVYRETIADCVEGVGHFEPLRHYAEVHLILEPLPTGSGMVFDSICSEDLLDKNWQRLILTHLNEKTHRGVLTGSPITDMRILLVSGRAHTKHTEGGDFRQATYRAVRQGLMEAQSVLLEPYYAFALEIPSGMVGRAMTDLEAKHAVFSAPEIDGDMAVLTGRAPVSAIMDYPMDVIAYTKGQGHIAFTFSGYEPCHNADAVIEGFRYDPVADVRNSPDSVFCAHGAGFNVPWNEVKQWMHLESGFKTLAAMKNGLSYAEAQLSEAVDQLEQNGNRPLAVKEDVFMDTEEVDAILSRTFYANKKDEGKKKWGRRRSGTRRASSAPTVYRYKQPEKPLEDYMLVDGYNIIYAWDEINDLMPDNMDGARIALMDILCNYQAMKKCKLMVVFDAYKVKGHVTEVAQYKNITAVYTKEAETADQYIEKFAHENAKKYRITVATSDGLEQIIIRSQGCILLSARDLWDEVNRMSKTLKEDFLEKQVVQKDYLFDGIDKEKLDQIIKDIKN